MGLGSGEKSNKEKFLASIEAIKNKDPLLAYEKSPSTDSVGERVGQASVKSKNDRAASNKLTANLAKLYIGEIAKRNPTLAGAETLTLPGESSLEEVMAAQIAQGIQSKTYTKKDVRASEASGVSAERAYLESFVLITQKNFAGTRGIDEMLGAFIEKQNPAPLQKYIDSATTQVADLLALETPKSLASFHLENLNLWQKKISVYGSLLESENDPLRSYVALQSIESIISENEALDKKLDDLARKFNS